MPNWPSEVGEGCTQLLWPSEDLPGVALLPLHLKVLGVFLASTCSFPGPQKAFLRRPPREPCHGSPAASSIKWTPPSLGMVRGLIGPQLLMLFTVGHPTHSVLPGGEECMISWRKTHVYSMFVTMMDCLGWPSTTMIELSPKLKLT